MDGSIQNSFTETFGLRLPVIMAPMFLVSNKNLIYSGMSSGILPVFPSLNFREKGELDGFLQDLTEKRREGGGVYGVNLIVQKTNPLFNEHLDLCVKWKVPFYITSLGNPEKVLEVGHDYGAWVFCDVTTMAHAEKAVKLGCDGLIAVGSGAGGHAGQNSLQVFVPALKKRFPNIPVIAAGGVASGAGLLSVLSLGASGASVGTRFIATHEAGVDSRYKEAIVQAECDDIVLTERLSGTPCTVINTPHVQKMGLKQGRLEAFLNRNPKTKKIFKGLTQLRGLRLLEKAAFKGAYKDIWCAGQTVSLVEQEQAVEAIVEDFVQEYYQALNALPGLAQTEVPCC